MIDLDELERLRKASELEVATKGTRVARLEYVTAMADNGAALIAAVRAAKGLNAAQCDQRSYARQYLLPRAWDHLRAALAPFEKEDMDPPDDRLRGAYR